MNRLVPPKHPKADARFINREPADIPPMSGSIAKRQMFLKLSRATFCSNNESNQGASYSETGLPIGKV